MFLLGAQSTLDESGGKMNSAEQRMAVLDFLSWPKEKQMEFLKDENIADITIKRFKTPNSLRLAKLESQRRRKQDLIHLDYSAIMSQFEVNLETGNVRRKGSHSLPQRTNQGYLTYQYKAKSYLCHRLVMMKAIETFIPSDLEVDHINMVVDDNRIDNLRLVSHRKNMDHWNHHKATK